MNKKTFFSDVVAGISVSFAALALGAAFGVMSGRGAFAGMIAAGIIPIVSGILGGTKLGISGPTAPMTAVSSMIIAFAYDNFQGDRVLAEQFITLVFLMTGLFLMLTAVLRLGKYIRLVPQVVIVGFMNGIALLIWVDQSKTLFGLAGKISPTGDRSMNVMVALATFALIMLIPWLLNRLSVPRAVRTFIPATLTGIVLATIATTLFMPGLGRINLGVSLETPADVLSHLITYFPTGEIFTTDYLLMALPYALELTLLGYLDSLLTALIMDRLTRDVSEKNLELFGQGAANAAAAVFQAIPGAQATIRSVLLYKEGGKTRLSVIVAGVFVLLGFFMFKDLVTTITSAVFIGVLFKAGLDVFEKDYLKTFFTQRWFLSRKRNFQFFLVVYTMLMTALLDLNVAVVTGVILFFVIRKFFRIPDLESDAANVEEDEKVVPETKKVPVRRRKETVDA